jgi:hypothetical protein
MSGEIPVPERRIDNDAPTAMRVELLNVIFALADETEVGPSERTLYNRVTGTLGVIAAVNPYGGARETGTALWMADVALRRHVDGVDQSVAPVIAILTSP